MSASLTSSSTSTSSAATTSSQLKPSPTGLKPTLHYVRIPAPSSRDARSSSLWTGSANSSEAIPKLTRQFSHVIIPARPRYTPNSATSSPLPPGPSLTPIQYGGPKMQVSSRSISRGQICFQLSRVADGVATFYPEFVPLERLFDFITPEELQKFEHEQYAVEEEEEKLRMTGKRRGRPPGSKKKSTVTGPSTQAESGNPSTRPPSSKQASSSVTPKTDPLQRDSERGSIKMPPPQTNDQSTTSGASTRSTRSRQSEEAEQGRYQMLPSRPRRTSQSITRSPTTNPAPLKTATPAQAQQYVSPAAKNNCSHQPTTVGLPPSRSLERANNETDNRDVFRPTAAPRPTSISSSADSNIIDLEDSDNDQSMNSEVLLRQFQGQSVQSLKPQPPSTERPKQLYNPNPTKAIAFTSSSPIPASSVSKKRVSPSKPPSSTPRTTSKKRKRLFTRKPPVPKPAQEEKEEEEDDWFVERIINHRTPSYPSAFNFEYLVKWQDHPHEENTWQSEDSLVGADEILKNYRATVAVEGAGEHGKSWVRSVAGSSGSEEDDDIEMIR